MHWLTLMICNPVTFPSCLLSIDSDGQVYIYGWNHHSLLPVSTSTDKNDGTCYLLREKQSPTEARNQSRLLPHRRCRRELWPWEARSTDVARMSTDANLHDSFHWKTASTAYFCDDKCSLIKWLLTWNHTAQTKPEIGDVGLECGLCTHV
jgi:hypothetical protein